MTDEPGEVEAATIAALEAADHLTDMDAGARATLLTLARKIDTEAQLREKALDWAAENNAKPPHVDNVSIPTYLKFCDALGLVPSGRVKLKPKAEEKPAGSLHALKDQAQKRRPA